MTLTDREVINSKHVADADSALEISYKAFDLGLSTSITNRIDHEGETPEQIFVIDLFCDYSSLRSDTNVDAFLMRDGFARNLPSEKLIARIETDEERALLDPRWKTNLMRLVPVWVAEDHDASEEYYSMTQDWYLEVYDAPIPDLPEGN